MTRAPILALAATLASLAGCATSSVAHPVKDVNFQGNKAFSDGDIIDHLATQPPQGWLFKTPVEFDRVGLQLDRSRVEAFYREHGYFSARVTDVNVQRNDDGGVKVTITVEEGDPTKVASIEVRGTNRPEDEKAVERALKRRDAPKKGDIFNHPDYLLEKDVLLRALLKRGYAHAKVEGVVEVDRDQHRAVINYDITPGPIVHFGKVKVEGLKTMPEDMVLNRVAWNEGDQFDPDKLDATTGRLTATGFFSAARPEYGHEGSPPVIDVTLRVAEASKHELRFGFGAGLDPAQYQLRLRGGYTQRTVFGDPLETFRIDVTPGWSWLRQTPFTSGPTIEVLAELARDDFFVPNLRGVADASFIREPRPGYILTGPALNLGVQYPFLFDTKVQVSWEIRETSFDDYDPLVFNGEAIVNWLGYFQQRAILDKRDRPLDARQGIYAEVEVLEGGPWAGGQVGFVRVTPELRGYVPLTPRLVLAARAKYGILHTAGGGLAPLPLRYYGGGANDNRGFGFERLAPQRRDSDGNLIPIGGSEMFLGSVETRLDLFRLWNKWLGIAVFMDCGDVTAPGALDFGNFNYAAGFGLRYNTIVGPIRADLGFRLNRLDTAGSDGLANPDPGDRFAFHISIGEAF